MTFSIQKKKSSVNQKSQNKSQNGDAAIDQKHSIQFQPLPPQMYKPGVFSHDHNKDKIQIN